jgi:hypothetical protein
VSLKETLRHKNAFELYYKQGESRSLSKVAKEIKAGEVTVRKWSVAFKWQDRVAERDKEIAARVEEINIEEDVNTRVLLNTATNESIELYRKMLKGKDSINVDTVKVLDILGRLYKELETQVETVNSQPQGVNEDSTIRSVEIIKKIVRE